MILDILPHRYWTFYHSDTGHSNTAILDILPQQILDNSTAILDIRDRHTTSILEIRELHSTAILDIKVLHTTAIPVTTTVILEV